MSDQPSGHDSPSREGFKNWTKWALNKARAAWRRATSPKEDWPVSPGAKFLWTVTLGHPFAAGLLVVVGLWIVTASIPRRVFPGKPDQAGQFGDTFGLMNALIGGFTLIGVAYAAWLQKVELDSTKTDLAETQEMMRRQSIAATTTAELTALNSLLDYYTKQAKIHNQAIDSGGINASSNPHAHIEGLYWNRMRDASLQLVRAKLAEIRTPNDKFNWGPVQTKKPDWAARILLTSLRDLGNKVQNWGFTGQKGKLYLLNEFSFLLKSFRSDLVILAAQDGISVWGGMLIVSMIQQSDMLAKKLKPLNDPGEHESLVLEIWGEIGYLLDEANFYKQGNRARANR